MPGRRGGAYAAATAAPTGGAQVTRQDDLVGWWKFDEESGTSAPDASGAGNDGTLVNTDDDEWVSGKFGNALDFDGTDDYVDIVGSESLNLTDNFSISYWVKHPGGNDNFTVMSKGTNCIWFVGVGHTGDQMKIYNYVYQSGWKNPNPVVLALVDTWYHIVVTVDVSADEVKSYRDGSLQFTKVIGGSPATNASKWNFGRYGTGTLGPFILDDTRFYGVTLSVDDVLAIYNSGDGDL